MALDQEAITQQLTLLAQYRRTLAHLLQQAAQYGGEVFAPPQAANGIAETRAYIARIKTTLIDNGIEVADEPNDDIHPPVEPIQRAGGNVVSGDTVAGDKVGGDKVMGDKRTVDTGGGDYAEGTIDKRQGAFISGGTIYGPVVGVNQGIVTTNYYYQPALTPLDRQQQRNRRAMLAKVKSIWIDGLLEQSLAKELRIALNLTEQPDAVDLPLNALVQELRHPPRQLPTGTPIIRVFEQMGGALLILGAPGAGKTTLLLELTRDLITRAEQDEGHPIPVVFNLSTWAEKRQSLKDWMIEELSTKYDVPRKLAQNWLDADDILLLLDGLDEVAVEHRAGCIETINSCRQDHLGLMPIAVCSRIADYEVLTTKLRLQGAVAVQPLTKSLSE